MRKIAIWSIAIITVFIDLAVLCLLDWVRALLIVYLSQWPFVLLIIEFFEGFLGECLEFGLGLIIYGAISYGIWQLGEYFIKKINDGQIAFKCSPTTYISYSLVCLFLISSVIIGIDFFTSIGEIVTAYTEGFTFWGKVIRFFDAIKDTYTYARLNNLWVHYIGGNSLLICVVAAIFCADKYPYKKEVPLEAETKFMRGGI